MTEAEDFLIGYYIQEPFTITSESIDRSWKIITKNHGFDIEQVDIFEVKKEVFDILNINYSLDI